MFGKPAWFRPKKFGWGIVPITWQGWAYTAAWCAAIATPYILLEQRHQSLESLVWVGFGIGALVFDVRQILLAMQGGATTKLQPLPVAARPQPDDGILYILDHGPAAAPVATRNYNLQLKRS